MTDFEVDENGEITGKLTTKAETQTAWILINSQKGTWKKYPFMGFDFEKMVNGQYTREHIEFIIRKEFRLDGAEVLNFGIGSKGFLINAVWQ